MLDMVYFQEFYDTRFLNWKQQNELTSVKHAIINVYLRLHVKRNITSNISGLYKQSSFRTPQFLFRRFSGLYSLYTCTWLPVNFVQIADWLTVRLVCHEVDYGGVRERGWMINASWVPCAGYCVCVHIICLMFMCVCVECLCECV